MMLSHLPKFVNRSAAGADLPVRRHHVVHTLTGHHSHGGGIWMIFLVLIAIAVLVTVAVVLYRKSRTAPTSMPAYTPAAPWQSGGAVGASWQPNGASPYAPPAYRQTVWHTAPAWSGAPVPSGPPAWSSAQANGWAAPALH